MIVLSTPALSRNDGPYKHLNNTIFTILMDMLLTNKHVSLFAAFSIILLKSKSKL